MQNIGPAVVARPGLTALRISVSGLELESSLRRNANSSAMTAIRVAPRMRLKSDERTMMVMRFISTRARCVRSAGSAWRPTTS